MPGANDLWLSMRRKANTHSLFKTEKVLFIKEMTQKTLKTELRDHSSTNAI